MSIHQATKGYFSRKYPPQALCVRLSFGIRIHSYKQKSGFSFTVNAPDQTRLQLLPVGKNCGIIFLNKTNLLFFI